jgi:ribose transport system substrate-binding protein
MMIKYMIRIMVVSLAIPFTFSSTVCADVNVLVIPKVDKLAFWSIVDKGAQQAGNDLGIRVTWRGPGSEDQHDAQINIIKYGIRQKYDAIVLAPNHTSAAAHALKKAVENGIKIVLIDSNMAHGYHGCLVESDNYKAGQTAADHLAALLGDEGRVILGRYRENNASTNDREQGFLDTIKSRYPGLEIVADPFVGSSIGSAYHAMSPLLEKESTIDAIFSVNGMITQGTLQALKSKGLQGKIKFIGFDLNPVIMDAIINHELDATIVQDPFQIGYMGVKIAYQLILHKKVPKKILTDTILLTAENYQTDKIKEFITPLLSSHKKSRHP